MEEGFDNLSRSGLYASLYGLRWSLTKFAGIKDCPIVTHERTALESLKDKKTGTWSYPRAYLVLTDIEILKDQQPPKIMQKAGVTGMIQDHTDVTVQRAFMFPTKINLDFHYLHTDLEKMTLFVEKLLLAGALEVFNFKINWGLNISWICRVEIPNNPISIPRGETDSPSDPAAIDINTSFVLHTRTGFFREISKINNQGMPTFNLSLKE